MSHSPVSSGVRMGFIDQSCRTSETLTHSPAGAGVAPAVETRVMAPISDRRQRATRGGLQARYVRCVFRMGLQARSSHVHEFTRAQGFCHNVSRY